MSISLASVTKKFKDVKAVDDLSLEVAAGEFLVLLGPSGCGKTTLLRCVAGFERPDEGEIIIDDKKVVSTKGRLFVAPQMRDVGMVFQSYAIWPHMTVFENIAFPLHLRKKPKDEVQKLVGSMLELVDLVGLDRRYPSQLSGGQQQRVALARALVYQPKVLLLDEPLSNLDAKLREQMRLEVKRIQRKLGITTIYVTHDQSEALVVGDRLVVMHRGAILQIGSPFDLYNMPSSEFVASFIGLANLIDGEISEIRDESYIINSKIGQVMAWRDSTSVQNLGQRSHVMLAIRPEDVQITAQKLDDANSWAGTIKERVFSGSHMEYYVDVAGTEFRVEAGKLTQLGQGDMAFLHVAPQYCRLIGIQ
ncbi:MAG: ABC transporter ATP-binding protein [Candidatus Bathyarchaeia archaeon]